MSTALRPPVPDSEGAPETAPDSPPPTSRSAGFKRRFLHMLGRDDPPEIVAASFAIGVAISFTPLIGLHLVIALFMAFLLKLNKLDVILGTLVVNPLTLGPVSAAGIWIGRFLLKARREALLQLPWRDVLQRGFWREAAPTMRAVGIQWAVGMFVLSFLMGAVVYAVLLKVLRERRRLRGNGNGILDLPRVPR